MDHVETSIERLVHNKVGAWLVIWNDVGTLVGAGSFPIVVLSAHEIEIRSLWEVFVWVSIIIPGQRIVLEGDV